MSSRRVFFILVTTFLVAQVFPLVPPAMAQGNNGNYIFLLASGFLCDSGDSSTCPATVKGNQGDSYEMSGAGTFDAQSKSVKAAGTYAHKSPNGNVLESGVWLANELVSFDSYGAAPNAIPSLAKGGLGPGAMGPKRMPMMNRGGMPTGGLAVLRIAMLPIVGAPTTAVLQVNCALGDVPHERSVEGIRLTVGRNHTEYAEELGGRVIYLAMTVGMSTPVKAPQEEQGEKVPENSEQPHN
jgi:hypothetical protein